MAVGGAASPFCFWCSGASIVSIRVRFEGGSQHTGPHSRGDSLGYDDYGEKWDRCVVMGCTCVQCLQGACIQHASMYADLERVRPHH
eukprot:1136842-Pelagomonas_calceolata.AAC.4